MTPLRRALLPLALVLLVIAAACGGGGPDEATPTAEPRVAEMRIGPTSTATAEPTPTATAEPTETPTPTAAASVSSAPARTSADTTQVYTNANNPYGLASADRPNGTVTRIRVPRVGIDAQVVTGEVDARQNIMLAPRGAWPVAWYPFSAIPGQGGNAVFSGHVDYINIGPAIFAGLRNVGVGDTVEVVMGGGQKLTYQVQFNRVYSAEGGPWASLFDPSAGGDVVTLYTCDGAFSGGNYASRRVVRAVRI